MEYQVTEFLEQISEQLSKIYSTKIEQNQVAWWLLEKLTEKTDTELLAQKTINLSPLQEKMLNGWLQEHIKNKKPLQYILGAVPFLDLMLKVTPPILIPRPETEEWISNLIEQLHQLKNQKLTILDIGTGSGCIALAAAKALPNSIVYATDISQLALKLAEENCIANNISNVRFVLSSVCDNIRNVFFDLIISNPPYIDPEYWQSLDPSVTEWEDKKALIAPQKGLAVIFAIIADAHKFLKENNEMKQLNIPQLVLEIDYNQSQSVTEYMERAGFTNIEVHKDLEGKNRVISGRLT